MLTRIRKNMLLKVLSLNSISVMVSFVLGIFSTKIVSIFLGPPGMALLGSFRNFTTMLKSVATIGIGTSVVKLIVENKSDRKALSNIYSTFFWVFLLLSIVLAVLVVGFASVLSDLLFFTPGYAMPIRFFGLLLPMMVLNAFWMAVYNAFEKFKKIVLIQIIANVLIFLLTALLIWKQQILGGLVAMAIGELLLLLVTAFYVWRDKEYFNFELTRQVYKKYLAVIGKFSIMALLSAVMVPIVLIVIRNAIVENYDMDQAGIWDAVNRMSSFYMILFSSGLSLYYMPKLASIHTDIAFKIEIKSYFKTLVPLFLVMLAFIYLFRGMILDLAFTPEFLPVKDLLIWQLLGDLLRIMALAFGFQILVKTMMKEYFILEIAYNLIYCGLSILLMKTRGVEGALQAYVLANLFSLVSLLWIFRSILKPQKLQ